MFGNKKAQILYEVEHSAIKLKNPIGFEFDKSCIVHENALVFLDSIPYLIR